MSKIPLLNLKLQMSKFIFFGIFLISYTVIFQDPHFLGHVSIAFIMFCQGGDRNPSWIAHFSFASCNFAISLPGAPIGHQLHRSAKVLDDKLYPFYAVFVSLFAIDIENINVTGWCLFLVAKFAHVIQTTCAGAPVPKSICCQEALVALSPRILSALM